MANSIYQVVFRIHCTACGQMLDTVANVEGVTYAHGNADDCDQPAVTLPPISPEQVSELFAAKKPPKPIPLAAASKTSSKKR